MIFSKKTFEIKCIKFTLIIDLPQYVIPLQNLFFFCFDYSDFITIGPEYVQNWKRQHSQRSFKQGDFYFTTEAKNLKNLKKCISLKRVKRKESGEF